MLAGIKKLFGQVDMTEGRPWEKIVLFTIPMLIGNIAQQLYNTVDSIVVGRYVGDNALAAVGSASPIFNLLLVLFVGISMGASIMVSQYYGSRDRVNLSRTIGKLSEREKTIIRLRFGLGTRDGQEMTQKEVAALLGISQSYISRLEKKIMKQLRREMSSCS